MVLFNYATKELTAKVVYYGPGLCGKTTNLQHIYDSLPGNAKGKMLSLATKTDRTLFFDFLPIDLGTIRGMKTKIQLYTVPGQVFYDTTRKLVLKGADGVVFVADSQAAMSEANLDSFENLITNLKEQNLELKNMPHVIQFNKRDMKNVLSVEELDKQLNRFNVPTFEAIAPKGDGVFESLKGISKLVLKHLGAKYGLEEEKKAEPAKPAMPELPNAGKPKMPDLPPTPAKPAPSPPKAAPAPKPAPPPQPAPQKVAASGGLDEIEFVEDDLLDDPIDLDDEPSVPAKSPGHLKPISTLDDSEVIELDDVDPLEFDELDDMAEIPEMASGSAHSPTPEPTPAPAPIDPIVVPVTINLPTSLEGKPVRLQIDILFTD